MRRREPVVVDLGEDRQRVGGRELAPRRRHAGQHLEELLVRWRGRDPRGGGRHQRDAAHRQRRLREVRHVEVVGDAADRAARWRRAPRRGADSGRAEGRSAGSSGSPGRGPCRRSRCVQPHRRLVARAGAAPCRTRPPAGSPASSPRLDAVLLHEATSAAGSNSTTTATDDFFDGPGEWRGEHPHAETAHRHRAVERGADLRRRLGVRRRRWSVAAALPFGAV